MKFDEFVKNCGDDAESLIETVRVRIANVTFYPHTRVELVNEDYDTALPPLDIWDDYILIGLLRMAAEQGVIDLDAIDIDPDNPDEVIQSLVGCTLQMPIRLDLL